ncbi:unnamed protein product [Clonostachys chloroleuca]|uniref:Uncharacterized protein n=1 Tax=Clonostachys chloroleuca TaxID=1926264 RepID=A0AA35MB77_9HYPO|nr:unnamed protein product [Clonostachys chloroleuca]
MGVQDSLSLGGRRAAALSLDANSNPPSPHVKGTIETGKASETSHTDPRTGIDLELQLTLPGTRCPTCAQEGKEVWVVPGLNCAQCGTPCD